jgi:AAA+ ATPase superfamily predicted ATPase
LTKKFAFSFSAKAIFYIPINTNNKKYPRVGVLIMSGYDDYKNTLFNTLLENTKTLPLPEERELKEILERSIFGSGPVETYVSKTKYGKYLSVLYQGWKEIDRTYSNIKDIEIYIKRFPYKETTINKINYIYYHIGNFLNEMYILENRLIDYPKKIIRANKKSPNFAGDEKRVKELEQTVNSLFQKIELIRGSHVHKYHFLDHELERIQMLSLIPDDILKDISNSDDFF